jgi:hypothetical protein
VERERDRDRELEEEEGGLNRAGVGKLNRRERERANKG